MIRSISLCFVTLLLFTANACYADTPIDLIIGESQFFHADSISIDSVESSGNGFEIGATITVKGSYTLNSLEGAKLCFYSTGMQKTGGKPTPIPVKESQRIVAKKGTHDFTLSKIVHREASPHLTFYHPKTGKPFGGVYFGDTSNVLMKKNWDYYPVE